VFGQPHPGKIAMPHTATRSQEAIGFVAAFLTTLSFLPQVIKVWSSRRVQDISLWMYALLTTGVALWCVYGLAIHALPVALANAVTLLLACSILVAKLRFQNR
jgi:MtN3 and saliva related transmembrane protein